MIAVAERLDRETWLALLEGDLAAARRRLEADPANGLEAIAEMGRLTLTAAADADATTAVAAWLLTVAVLVHNSRRDDLAGPLADRLRPHLAPPASLAVYLDDRVIRTFACCQLDRAALFLPASLAGADSGWLMPLADRLNAALGGLPPATWRRVRAS